MGPPCRCNHEEDLAAAQLCEEFEKICKVAYLRTLVVYYHLEKKNSFILLQDRDSLNKSDVKGHNLTPTVSLEPEENDASCQLELPESPSFEHICKKRCTDALLHSNLEQMRRERIKDCCDQLRVLLPYVKGRRTDVASILEMTVEYMRYIYDRIPNNIISQILEIFKTNSRYCKYVWKADDHKDSRYKLTSGRSGSTSNPSSEKIKSKIQYAPYQITGNEYFKNHKTDGIKCIEKFMAKRIIIEV
ncbi:uncharacterized protein [Narcine bancroftii]|uniref:uncharacterized protein n=1 Tax=Narcine bancroftii TaxID=1343680 RepID=UPI003831B1AD